LQPETHMTYPDRARPLVVHRVRHERFPRHVAIIMDGNGRWAKARGLPRAEGHRRGAAVVREVITTAARAGLGFLTLYSFSIENWKRPAGEVNALMGLYAEYLRRERATLMTNNIRLLWFGRRDGLPPAVLDELDRGVAATAANTGLTLGLALNYGSRLEIADAVRAIARDVRDGRIDPEQIAEQTISQRLYTAAVPDPDLLIRTAGERRISNFLLWQISYCELHVTDVMWPDFTRGDFLNALRDYASRERRFGQAPR